MNQDFTRTQRVILVYVHIGQTVPIQLIHHAKEATRLMPAQDIFLITDADCSNFPGVLVAYTEADWNSRYQNYLNKFPEISEPNDGYWDFTLRRLLVLGLLESAVLPDTRIIHVESDVLLLLPLEYLLLALKDIDYPALPRLGDQGIASFVYFPNVKTISEFLTNILKTLDSTDIPLTDMMILGIGLSNGWLIEIPSVPISTGTIENQIIFDGAAFGQYLFGVDPIHTEGKLVSGFQNQFYSLELRSVKWRIDKLLGTNISALILEFEGKDYYLADLHIHSKILLKLPSLNSKRWIRAINEANGGTRELEKIKIVQSRRTGLSIIGKIKKARRIGLLEVLKLAARKISRRYPN